LQEEDNMPVYNYTTIDDPLATTNDFQEGTAGNDINDTSQIVGRYDDKNCLINGFLFSGGTLTTLDNPLATIQTIAVGINNAG